MPGSVPLVGRVVKLRFSTVDATPDLHEMGEVTARVTGVALEGSPPSSRISAEVQGPAAMRGLKVVLSARYEGEPLEGAAKGDFVTVEAFFTDANGRAVAGGIGEAAWAS